MKTNTTKQLFFDDAAPRWVREEEQRSARLASLFAAGMLPAAGPVLDVGSGTGILIPHLLAAGCRPVLACEISHGMLQQAQARHGNAEGTLFVQGDGQRLPLRDRSCGTVHCFSVFPHFDAPAQALGEFRRVLRPGGTLCILHLMDHEELNALHREAGHAVAKDILPPVHRLAADVAAHGFRVTQAEERPGLYLLTAALPPLL